VPKHMLWHMRVEKLKSGNGAPANACQAGRPRRKAYVLKCECSQNCSRPHSHSHSHSPTRTRTRPRTKSFNCLWPRMCECDCPSFSFAARAWIRFGLVSCCMWAQLIFVAYMQHVIVGIMMMQMLMMMAMPYAAILCNPLPDKCPT